MDYVVHYEMTDGDVGMIQENVVYISVKVDAWIEINRELRSRHGERYKIVSYLADDINEVIQVLSEYFA